MQPTNQVAKQSLLNKQRNAINIMGWSGIYLVEVELAVVLN